MCSRAPRIVYACKEISACAFFGRVNIIMLHIYTKTNFPRVLHFSAFILCCMHAYTVRHCNCAEGLHFSAFINLALGCHLSHNTCTPVLDGPEKVS